MKHSKMSLTYKLYKLVIVVCFAFAASISTAQTSLNITDEVVSYTSLYEYNITVNGNSELHLTGDTSVLTNSTINLASDEAWLYFDNVKPSEVLSSYISKVKINGEAAVKNVNFRIRNYTWGTLIIPHSPSFQPLEIFTGMAYTGDSQHLSTFTFYRSEPTSIDGDITYPIVTLDAYSDKVSSFKLKRGYMATFAQSSDGTGYSRVYVADKEDIEVPTMPLGLKDDVSFIRVFPWNYPSKKGMTYEGGTQMLRGSWYYNWGSGKASTNNTEYVPMKWGGGYAGAGYANKSTATHLLGFNEPSHSEQSNLTVDKAIEYWASLQKSGLRLGSPGIADNGKPWLWKFMDKADELNLRIDFVAVHYYQGGKTAKQMYTWLKEVHDRTGRPVWVTEWNNGANWTNEGDPTLEEQAADIAKMIEMMDTTSWIERYAIYNWVENCRAVILKDELTPAGIVYRDHYSPLAYNPDKDFYLPYSGLTKPYLLSGSSTVDGVALKWKENISGDKGVIIERSMNGANYEVIDSIEGQAIDSFTDETAVAPGSYSYRVKYYTETDETDYSNIFTLNVKPANAFNVVVGRPVTVDSYFNSSYTGEGAVDGDNSANDESRWVSAKTAFPHWIEVDLQGTYNISWLSFYTGFGGYNKAIYDFVLEYYNLETNTWEIALSITDNDNPEFHSAFEEVTTNKVRLKGTRAIDEIFRLYELEVLGTSADANSYINVALNKTAKTSSTHSSGNYPGSKAVDGNNSYDNSSRWVSDGEALPEWIEIDLNGSFTIDRVRLFISTYGDDGPFEAFNFEYYDGSQWNELFSKTDNTNDYFETTFEAVVATKVRLNITGGPKTVRLHEIEVFGQKNDNASITVNAISSYQIFPNPVVDFIQIKGLEKATTIEIYDISGKQVLTSETDNRIDVTHLLPGIYFVNIENETVLQFIK